MTEQFLLLLVLQVQAPYFKARILLLSVIIGATKVWLPAGFSMKTMLLSWVNDSVSSDNLSPLTSLAAKNCRQHNRRCVAIDIVTNRN